MVTGDNVITARSVAVKCGIVKPDDESLVYDGEEFNSYIRDPDKKVTILLICLDGIATCRRSLTRAMSKGFFFQLQSV